MLLNIHGTILIRVVVASILSDHLSDQHNTTLLKFFKKNNKQILSYQCVLIHSFVNVVNSFVKTFVLNLNKIISLVGERGYVIQIEKEREKKEARHHHTLKKKKKPTDYL